MMKRKKFDVWFPLTSLMPVIPNGYMPMVCFGLMDRLIKELNGLFYAYIVD